jgi:hypothetical protein
MGNRPKYVELFGVHQNLAGCGPFACLCSREHQTCASSWPQTTQAVGKSVSHISANLTLALYRSLSILLVRCLLAAALALFPSSLNFSTKCMLSIFQVPAVPFAAAVLRLRHARCMH